MRIIAGEFRGRRLLPPAGVKTRPITDRVKQSLFDIVSPLIPDAVVYDCYAGTGSMGLESLSRGARLAYFFEADRSAGMLLKKNIEALKKELGGYLGSPEIGGLLARRDVIVKLFESRGDVVLYDRKPPEQGCKP